MVQAIIAGGKEALQRSIEGAEDDFISGQSEIYGRNVNPRDFVLGIAASGTTRFVWGALSAAHEKGAKTMLLCFNPNLKMPSAFRPEIVICANTGAELLTGSTRLKAGTATKMILNIISTLSMARIGRVKGNLMLRMLPTNEKLRQRAIRIVSQAGNVSPEIAKDLLEKSNWDIQSAIDQAIRLAR
jgi:N-acetylmuramic acid 6-phosphate etherase